MEKEFVPYELAVKLKELGFYEKCLGAYASGELFIPETGLNGVIAQSDSINGCTAPLYQQAFRWFREKYVLFSGVLSEYSYGGEIHAYHINGKRQETISKGDFITYEEAELACLTKLIEIVKGGQDE